MNGLGHAWFGFNTLCCNPLPSVALSCQASSIEWKPSRSWNEAHMSDHFIRAGTDMVAKTWSNVCGHHGFPGIAINELTLRHPKTRLYVLSWYEYNTEAEWHPVDFAGLASALLLQPKVLKKTDSITIHCPRVDFRIIYIYIYIVLGGATPKVGTNLPKRN